MTEILKDVVKFKLFREMKSINQSNDFLLELKFGMTFDL